MEKLNLQNELSFDARYYLQKDSYENFLIKVMVIKNVKESGKKFKSKDDLYLNLVKTSEKTVGENVFLNTEDSVKFYNELPLDFDLIDFCKKASYAYNFFTLPENLINIFEKSFDKNVKTVLIAEAFKFIFKLAEIAKINKNIDFTLSCNSEFEFKLLEFVTEGFENVKIVKSDVYSSNFLKDKFDLILSFPNLGRRMDNKNGDFLCNDSEMIALEVLLNHLNESGNLLILLSGKINSAQHSIKKLRDHVKNEFTLKEIIELPANSLPFTVIQTYLIKVKNSKDDKNDIVLKRYEKVGKLKDFEILEKDTLAINYDKFNESDTWSVKSFFDFQSESFAKFINSKVKKEELCKNAEVFRGKNITNKSENKSIAVINISNIGENELNTENLDYIDEEERKINSYLLKDGDILLPARGTVIKTAIFHQQDFKTKCIASSNIIVIRPFENLNSTYLKAFLDSEVGKKIISQANQGTIIMNISYNDLKSIKIPILPIDEQKKIAATYNEELAVYKDTIDKANNRWNKFLSELKLF